MEEDGSKISVLSGRFTVRLTPPIISLYGAPPYNWMDGVYSYLHSNCDSSRKVHIGARDINDRKRKRLRALAPAVDPRGAKEQKYPIKSVLCTKCLLHCSL